MSDSLRPHGMQPTRPPCPSPTPRTYSNSCPLSWWCHPTISSSVVPFSSRLQSFPASGSFQMSHLFTSGGPSIGVSASTSVLRWYTDTYIRNLERWHWWINFQGSNGETDIENRPMDMGSGEEEEGEMYGESNMETFNTICKIDSQWEFTVWPRELKQGLFNNLEGWDGEGDGREFQERGDMGIPVADSCWCMTENHKILWSNYPSTKKKKTSGRKSTTSDMRWHEPYGRKWRGTKKPLDESESRE